MLSWRRVAMEVDRSARRPGHSQGERQAEGVRVGRLPSSDEAIFTAPVMTTRRSVTFPIQAGGGKIPFSF